MKPLDLFGDQYIWPQFTGLNVLSHTVEHLFRPIKRIPVNPQSICVHGDNAEAVEVAQAIREGLAKAGYTLATIPQLVG